ncbi:MAG: ferredoxin [Epsilonproteobacteria bacterium]|nr:ferredoxin [Campylobacterota bacterium]
MAKPSKVEVDQETCIGCGVCADMVPDVFEMQDGKSIVINAQGAEYDEVQEAVEACPVECITAEE